MAKTDPTPAEVAVVTEEPKDTSLWDKLGGRKFLLIALGMVCVTAVGIAKEVDSMKVMEYIVYLAGIGVGGVAIENVFAKK